jgi:hypothetical protein
MKFKLPDFDLSPYRMVYAGERPRYATATAAAFVNDNKILVASFLNKKIFLIDITDNNFNIISEISTPHYPDLMDYKDGVIVVTNRTDGDFEAGGISVYSLIDDEMSFKKTIIIKNLNQIHGCRIIDEKNFIITNTTNNERGVYSVNYDTEKTNMFNNFEFFPKDIWVYDDKILIISSHSRPSGTGQVKITNSYLYLYEYPSYKKIDELFFYGQTDALTYHNGDGFITLQGQDSLLHFKITNDKIENVKLIDGFDFPHGVASNGDKVVVTNYGDNSIDILSFSDLIK